VNRINLLAALALAAALAACSGGSSTGTFTAPPPIRQLTLKFDVQPSSGLAGEAMTVKVSVHDASGQVAGSGNVTLALGANPTGSALGGTVTRAAVNGVATFDDLVIVKAGQGYTLTASGQGMTSATTDAFSRLYSTDENETVAASNDTPAGAVAITPDIPMFGNLAASDDVDFYKFHATAGQILSVSSYATRLDLANWDTSLELHLIAPDGTTELSRMSASDWGIASIDNGFAAIRIPADGDYFLACDLDASGSLISAAAKYALLLKLSNPAVAPQLEAATGHDSIANAQPISPGLVAGQYQSATNGSDYYKLTIQNAPTRVRLDLIASRNGVASPLPTAAAGFDGVMELQDAQGTVLWHNDDTVFLDPAIDYVVTANGTYYVRITQFGIDPVSAPYLLSYDAAAYALPSVAGASSAVAALAAPIAYGQTVRTSFANAAGGQQFFAFDGNAGDLVRLWVDDKSVSQGSTLQMDPSLAADAMFLAGDGVTMLAAAAQPATSVPASASELNVRQTILQTSGMHYVSVSSPAGGAFGFRLDRIAAAGSAPGWISAALPSGATAADNKNHHTVHAEAGQLVTVSVLAGAGPSDAMLSPFGNWGSAILPAVQILDGQGKVVAATSADRLGSTNFAESMLRPEAMLETSFRAPAAGDYDVVVADANGLGGPAFFYALQVWKNQ
jgi:hypothetical protein